MIKVRNLSKYYGEQAILKDVNADIGKGEVISVIGRSGTGKSTFLRCLNLLEYPSGGMIEIDGISLLDSGSNPSDMRRRMGMVFQSFNLYEHLPVIENLAIAPVRLLRIPKEQAAKNALKLLKLVGLAEKAFSFPHELSGGQKQRVAIARCLAMNPDILLFDEPTSALDPTMVVEVLSVIRRLAREGLTMIIVTHEMEFARKISSRIFYMDEGTIYEEGTPDQIFENPQKEKTKAFINRIMSLEFEITSSDYDLYAIQAEIQIFCNKYLLPQQLIDNTKLLTEEILLLQKEFTEAFLRISYSEKAGSVELVYTNRGKPENPLWDEEDFGVKIITGLCQKVNYKYENGWNIINLIVRH